MRAIIAAAAGLVAITPALAQKVPTLSPEDARRVAVMHAQYDRNHDGQVTLLEMRLYGVEHGKGAIIRMDVWNQMDANHDGMVSLPEMTRFIAAIEAQHRLPGAR